MKLAGLFWKNPKVFENFKVLKDILHGVHKTSLMTLLPHLEEWAHRHTIRGVEGTNHGYADFSLRKPIEREHTYFTFGMGGSGSSSIRSETDIRIFTTAGLYRGCKIFRVNRLNDCPSDEKLIAQQELTNRSLRAKYPILQPVEDAEPHSWWLFELFHYERDRWFLVNYQERMIWHPSLKEDVIYLWNQEDDIWFPKGWKLAEAAHRHGYSKPIWELLVEIGSDEGSERDEEIQGADEVGSDLADGDDTESDGSSFDNDDSDCIFHAISQAFRMDARLISQQI